MCYEVLNDVNLSLQCTNYDDYEIFSLDKIIDLYNQNYKKLIIMDYGNKYKFVYKTKDLLKYCINHLKNGTEPKDPICRKKISLNKILKLSNYLLKTNDYMGFIK